jgi:hypothetical protein
VDRRLGRRLLSCRGLGPTVVADSTIAKTLAEPARVIPGVPTKNPVVMSPGSKSNLNRALVLAALGGVFAS